MGYRIAVEMQANTYQSRRVLHVHGFKGQSQEAELPARREMRENEHAHSGLGLPLELLFS